MSIRKIYFRLLRRIGILKHLNINIKSIVNKRQVLIPVINEKGLSNYLQLSEIWMIDLIQRLYQDSLIEGCFVDVGANIGQTLIKIKSIDPDIHYIGFEPNPNCINYLEKLIQTNNYNNSKIVPVAISDKTAVTELIFVNNSEIDSSASLIKNFRSPSSGTKTLQIPAFKFADIEYLIPDKIGLLKIDVEGAELEVLSSFIKRVTNDRSLILVEILPAYNKGNHSRINRQNKIFELVEKNRYLIYRILKINDDFQHLQKMDQFEIHDDLDLCDYLLIPDILHRTLINLF